MIHPFLTLESPLPMLPILAVETATDACSVAFYDGREMQELFEIAPRQHSALVFTMLEQLVSRQSDRLVTPQLIAFGAGPGSFTGLRIAASFAQGLSFAMRVPALGVSTLAALAEGAWRNGSVPPDRTILACLDARIGQLYVAYYALQDGAIRALTEPLVARAQDIEFQALSENIALVGDGSMHIGDFPQGLRDRIVQELPEAYPRASDVLAIARLTASEARQAGHGEILPNYVHTANQWKTLAEQQAMRT